MANCLYWNPKKNCKAKKCPFWLGASTDSASCRSGGEVPIKKKSILDRIQEEEVEIDIQEE